jgi:CDGSH-type Zn-finger protein
VENTKPTNSTGKIQVTKNGPYLISGNLPLYRMIIQCNQKTSTPAQWVTAEKLPTQPTYSLCRCGQTKNKPFCDGTHLKIKFDGTEVSDNTPYEKMAKEINGPQLTLKDAEILCASARFCHRGGDIWEQIAQSDDPKIKANCVTNESDCPSGRLVVVDKATGKAIEPKLEQSVGLIEDPAIGRDGPLWIRGGVPVYSFDGKLYEVRNRMTLCRCGKSTNKPFCDSSHYPEEYQEER